MPKSLNEIKLQNLFAELQMAYGADNESRIATLKEGIGIIQRDIALRSELVKPIVDGNKIILNPLEMTK